VLLAAPVVILAAGDFPRHHRPLQALREAGSIIACDAAADKLLQNHLEADWVVGDLDSISASAREHFGDRLVELADQNYYDLEKAVVWVAKQGAASTTLVGATGLRDDHALANQLLLFTDFGIEIELLTETGSFSVVRGQVELNAFSGQAVALFAESMSVMITTSGLAYELVNQPLTGHHRGIANHAYGEAFSVRASGGAVLVFQAYPA
jgi:thiamine pyrophosphokinase